jgi:hypothetical protein
MRFGRTHATIAGRRAAVAHAWLHHCRLQHLFNSSKTEAAESAAWTHCSIIYGCIQSVFRPLPKTRKDLASTCSPSARCACMSLPSPRRAFGPGLSYLGLSGRWIFHFLSVRTRGPARSWAASGTSFVRVVALSISGVPAPPFGTLPYIARHMHAGNGE